MLVKDGSGRMFFSVSADGTQPLSIQRKLFGEVFYCLALLGMTRATKEQKYLVGSHHACAILTSSPSSFFAVRKLKV